MFNSKSWNYRRGDIYLADLGEHHGHIQGGTRPVVVVQNDYGNRFAPTLIVVPLTTEIKKADMPTHYVLRHQRGWTSHAWPWPNRSRQYVNRKSSAIWVMCDQSICRAST